MNSAIYDYRKYCALRNHWFTRLDPDSSNAEAAIILKAIEDVESNLERLWDLLTPEEQAEFIDIRGSTLEKPDTPLRKQLLRKQRVRQVFLYAVDVLLPLSTIILEVLAWQNHRPGVVGSCIPGVLGGMFCVWTFQWYAVRFRNKNR